MLKTDVIPLFCYSIILLFCIQHFIISLLKVSAKFKNDKMGVQKHFDKSGYIITVTVKANYKLNIAYYMLCANKQLTSSDKLTIILQQTSHKRLQPIIILHL